MKSMPEHEEHYVCYWDLLSDIPSLEDPAVSVKEGCKSNQ